MSGAVETKVVHLSAPAIEAVRVLCSDAIRRQERGERVQGHWPRSGVFAECSMECEEACLALQARRLLKELEGVG